MRPRRKAPGPRPAAYLRLATALQLHTVAEGVEDAEQRTQLIALGCGYGQGYLFAKPASAEAISALMNTAGAPAVETRPLEALQPT